MPITVGRAYPANHHPSPAYARPSMPPALPKASWPADPVPSAESGSPTGLLSQQPGLEASLIRLIGAVVEQTAAIYRLASSNEALVQAMAQSEGMADDDAQPGAYLNGSPVR